MYLYYWVFKLVLYTLPDLALIMAFMKRILEIPSIKRNNKLVLKSRLWSRTQI